jgi:hypothetical protein
VVEDISHEGLRTLLGGRRQLPADKDLADLLDASLASAGFDLTPGPDFCRQATASLRTQRDTMSFTSPMSPSVLLGAQLSGQVKIT